jgi:acyl carrier protein
MQQADRIRQIAGDVFKVPVEGVSLSSSPDTIESWDSMHHLELVLALEQEFDIQFSPEEIEQLLSLELVNDITSEKLKRYIPQ